MGPLYTPYSTIIGCIYLRPLRNVEDGVGPALHAAVDLLRGHLRDLGQPALQQHRRQVSTRMLCEICT